MEILKKVVAKILSCQDNDSYMLHNFNEYKTCPTCTRALERVINPNFKLTKRKYDISGTYDGYDIVSKRFKDFCINQKIEGVTFKELEKEKDFYVMDSSVTVELDHERRKTRFNEYCSDCEQYYSIAGASPNFFKNPEQQLTNSIYASDILYGHGEKQHPIFIINLDVYKIMKKQKFKGIIFLDILA